MVDNKTISELITSQLPDFVQEQYPEFCQFLVHYYEFLELPDNPIYKTNRILREISLDHTSESGLSHFVEYLGKYLPAEFVGDKSQLLKHIKEFYLSRGTEESYRFFMSMMYGFDIGNKTKIDYPIERVLHTSLGEWTERKSIKINFIDVNLSELINKEIVDEFGVSAIIENAFSYYVENTQIIELFLQTSSISGNFSIGNASIDDFDVEIIPVVSKINISNYGELYTKSDAVTLYTENDYYGLIFNGSNVHVRYNLGTTNSVVLFGARKISAKFKLDNLTGTRYLWSHAEGAYSARIQSGNIYVNNTNTSQTILANTEYFIEVNYNASGQAISVKLNNSTVWTGTAASVSSYENYLYIGCRSYFGAPTDRFIGNIWEFEISNYLKWNGYGSDNSDWLDVLGNSRNATVFGTAAEELLYTQQTNITNGLILKISDIIAGQIYKIDTVVSGINFDVNEEYLIDINTINGINFSGKVIIGSITNYPGFYRSNKHLLSEESIRLQDNNFYQQFSYVIESPVALNNYQAQVLDALHPAGRKLFGKFQFEELIEFVSEGEGVEGYVDATIWSEALQRAIPEDGEGIIHATIQSESINVSGLNSDEIQFLSYRAFYPNELNSSDMQFSDGYFSGKYSYNFSDRLTYIGGLANTQSLQILANEALQPDPVLYKMPFKKEKAKFWISGSSRTSHRDSHFEFEGDKLSTKWQVKDSTLFNFGNTAFGIKFDFVPREAVDKALISLCGSSNFNTGSNTDHSEIWGGQGTGNWISNDTARSYGIGFSADRKIYVKLFDPTDSILNTDGGHTYTHTVALDLNKNHSVTVTYSPDDEEVIINVNGNEQIFSHTSGINLAPYVPLIIGGTYRRNTEGRSHTFKGQIKNIGIWNRTIESTEFDSLKLKDYNKLKAQQKHGLIFFSNMSYPFPADETDYNATIQKFLVKSVANFKDLNYLKNRGIQLILDPSSDVTLTSGAVSSWKSMNGSGVEATQGTAGNRPILTSSTNKENLFSYSDDVSQAAWTKGNCTITGTDTLVENAGSGQKTISQYKTSGLDVTGTVIVEAEISANGRTDARVIVYDGGSNVFGLVVNLTTGVGVNTESGTYSVISRTVSDMGDGWYRVRLEGSLPTATQVGLYINPMVGGNNSYTGDGVSGIKVRSLSIRRPNTEILSNSTNATPVIAGNNDRALYFDGTNDTLGTALAVNPTGGLWAIAVVRFNKTATTNWIITNRNNNSNDRFSFAMGSGGRIGTRVMSSNTDFIGRDSPNNSIVANEIAVVSMIYDGSGTSAGIKVFKNLTQIDTVNDAGGSYSVPAAGSVMRIGENSVNTINGALGPILYGQGFPFTQTELLDLVQSLMNQYVDSDPDSKLITDKYIEVSDEKAKVPNLYLSNQYFKNRGIQIALDPDQNVTLNSDFIHTIDSIHGSGVSFNQATLANRPLLSRGDNKENLFVNSENMAGSGWTSDNTSWSSGVLTENSSNGYHGVYQSANCLLSVSYTATAWVKAKERTNIIMWLNNNNGGVVFDLLNGTVASKYGTIYDATITSEGDGIYKCSIIGNSNLTGSRHSGVAIYNGANTYTGDGTSGIYFYKFQYRETVNSSEYIISNSVPNVAGVNLNRVIKFDGSDDKLDSSFACNPLGGCGCVMFLNPFTAGVARDLLSSWNTASSSTRFLFQIEAANRLGAYIASSTSNYIGRYSNSNTIVALEPIIASMTYDGSLTSAGIKIYKNLSRIDSTNSNSGTITGDAHTAGHNLKIGTRENNVNFFNGKMGAIIYWQGFVMPEDELKGIIAAMMDKYLMPKSINYINEYSSNSQYALKKIFDSTFWNKDE